MGVAFIGPGSFSGLLAFAEVDAIGEGVCAGLEAEAVASLLEADGVKIFAGLVLRPDARDSSPAAPSWSSLISTAKANESGSGVNTHSADFVMSRRNAPAVAAGPKSITLPERFCRLWSSSASSSAGSAVHRNAPSLACLIAPQRTRPPWSALPAIRNRVPCWRGA